jgi:flagellar hook assembly protein FlgD
MTVTDKRDSITVYWSGRNSSNQTLVSYSFTFPVGMLTDTKEPQSHQLPDNYALDQNYPNPFNPSTTIQFELPRRTNISIAVYNILGQEVKVLIDRLLSPGTHSVSWDGTNSSGNSVPGGVYFYRMNADAFVSTRKMVLLK